MKIAAIMLFSSRLGTVLNKVIPHDISTLYYVSEIQ